MELLTLDFQRQQKSEIFIDSGILFSPWFIKVCSTFSSDIAILTDAFVEQLYGKRLLAFLQNGGLKASLFSFPEGEQSKNRATKESIEDQMQEKGLGRSACFVAIGGGVVGDIGGYIASTYCRGIPLVFVPTTLLAMVDSSIGGKNGVNTLYGKNRVGTIYQPHSIIMDLDVLDSLSLPEWKNGLAEIIKYALIADEALFQYLESHVLELLAKDKEAVKHVILESCKIKKRIVERDEQESGMRRILNFGHTIGHALEAISSYQIKHGEAVVIGSVAASYLSWKKGYLDAASFERIVALYSAFNYRLHRDAYSLDEMMKKLALDKKSLNNKPRFVLLEKIGWAKSFSEEYCTCIEEPELLETLQYVTYDLHCC